MGCCSLRCFHVFVALVGLGLNGYAYYVERRMAEDETYKPLCDVDESISCSKPFNSAYGRGFGLVKYAFGERAKNGFVSSLLSRTLVFFICPQSQQECFLSPNGDLSIQKSVQSRCFQNAMAIIHY